MKVLRVCAVAMASWCACAGAPSPEPATPEPARPASGQGSTEPSQPAPTPMPMSDPVWQDSPLNGWYCWYMESPGPISTCFRSLDACEEKTKELRGSGMQPGECRHHSGKAGCFRKINTVERYVYPVCYRSMEMCRKLRLRELEAPRTSREIFTDCEEVE